MSIAGKNFLTWAIQTVAWIILYLRKQNKTKQKNKENK